MNQDDTWFQEKSDSCVIREHLPFFECIQRGENVGKMITRHQSRRVLRMGLTFRGPGDHWPLQLTRYANRLLEQIQQETQT